MDVGIWEGLQFHFEYDAIWISDSAISTLDHKTLTRTLYYYGSLTAKELLTKGKDLGLLLKVLLPILIVVGLLFWLIK